MRIETFWKAEPAAGLIWYAKVAKPSEERVQEVAFGVTIQSWEWLFLADRRRARKLTSPANGGRVPP